MTVFLAFITSLIITAFAIPSIIKVANLKHLYDTENERRSHKGTVPTLGGLAIFAGLIFSVTFWSSMVELIELQYIISSMIIIFFVGLKDDIINLVAWKKLATQLVAAFILVHWGGIHITTMYGLFGVDAIPPSVSYLLSIFTIIVITNSFNLIDGIDTLSSSVGILSNLTFGIWFYLFGSTQYAILAFALVGSLLAFLYFNKTPAQIFMGDTGSLILGLVSSIFAIKFIEMNRILPKDADYKVLSVPVVTIGILIIPLFDTLRVFLLRMFEGRSPLSPDRKHIHHILIDAGLSHMKASTFLILANIGFIALGYLFQGIKGELMLVIYILLASFMTYLCTLYKKKELYLRNILFPLRKKHF